VAAGRLPGWLITVSRRGQLAWAATHGLQDTEARRPVSADTLWRIYSRSKPVTSVAAASTFFLIDNAEQLVVTFFTQLLPSSTYPIRSQLRQLVYQAITD
jgi:CubicO group peptidase (beta-lactamase class C family)